MAEIVLFHHVQGLTDGIRAFADELRAAGHTVHTPDLYGGRIFDSIDAGLAHAREVGFGTLQERALAEASALPADIFYGGFSMGVGAAQQLAQTRPGARGAILMYGALPASEFGPWPAGVGLQIHGMEGDPWFQEDIEAARQLAASVSGAELFLYPGDRHLFADSSLPEYDREAAALLTRRVLDFLAANQA